MLVEIYSKRFLALSQLNADRIFFSTKEHFCEEKVYHSLVSPE